MALYIPMITDWYMTLQVLDHFASMELNGWTLYNLPAFLILFSNLHGGLMIGAH